MHETHFAGNRLGLPATVEQFRTPKWSPAKQHKAWSVHLDELPGDGNNRQARESPSYFKFPMSNCARERLSIQWPKEEVG